jgi:hypothetical protein
LTFVFVPIVPATPRVTLPAASPASRQAPRRTAMTDSTGTTTRSYDPKSRSWDITEMGQPDNFVAERVVPTQITLESLLDIQRRLIGSGISREAAKKTEVFFEFPMQNPSRLRVFA